MWHSTTSQGSSPAMYLEGRRAHQFHQNLLTSSQLSQKCRATTEAG